MSDEVDRVRDDDVVIAAHLEDQRELGGDHASGVRYPPGPCSIDRSRNRL